MADNKLYYGDNLVVLREHVRDESVDLVYLDPPFNSRQDYNVLFAENGFFTLARDLGLLRPGDDETVFWEKQCDLVDATWQRPIPVTQPGK